MQKGEMLRLFVALILSMSVIYLWNNYFYPKPDQEVNQDISNLEAGDPQKLETSANTGNLDQETPRVDNSLIDNSSNISQIKAVDNQLNQQSNAEIVFDRGNFIEQGYSEKSRIKINTPRVHGSINLRGAVFDDLTLANYKQDLSDDAKEVVLLSPKGDENIYIVKTGWVATNNSVVTPTSKTLWSLESGSVLSPDQDVVLTWQSPQNLTFRKTISVDDKYMIFVRDEIINTSARNYNFAPYAYVNKAYDYENTDIRYQYISHKGPIAVADDVLHELSYSDLVDDGNKEFKNVKGWAGISDKYWQTALIPAESVEDKFNLNLKYYRKDKLDRFQSDIMGGILTLQANSVISNEFEIYAGAKKLEYIDYYQKEFNIPLFDRSIDFGFLYFLTRPIFEALTFFNNYLGNFGYAILALTVLIKLILFPLANKSYRSMARMRKHMPEIQRLKERYKNDRQKLGIEMMTYYKEHKINPMSGCLPLFVQIPVFFSLYKVLVVTIEMRHSSFTFIEDLSAKDPTNILTLFGLLEWTPPAWIPAIGILPLLFAITMVVQQKLNPPPTDETQKIVMAWLPWIFMFVFASFPAGLVVYWVWNNILSIIQQYIITRKINSDANE